MIINLLYASIATTIVGIIGKYAEKRYNDLTITDVIEAIKSALSIINGRYAITKTTGTKKLVLVNSGENKATVLATLRQITGIDYSRANDIVTKTPSVIMTNISDKEADLTRQALEFVGAKCEIK